MQNYALAAVGISLVAVAIAVGGNYQPAPIGPSLKVMS